MCLRVLVILLPILLNAQTVATIAANGDIALANLQNSCDPNRFEQTSHLFADKRGLYLADTRNQRIRRFNPDGTATTIAGDGTAPPASCASFNPVNDGANALAAHLYNPSDMVVRPNGNVVIADQQNNRIREVSANGAIATIAGNGLHFPFIPGVPATASTMDWPTALALDSAGNVLFTEIHTHRIGRINAGTGRIETAVDNPAADTRLLSKPMGITVDRDNNILIADTGNHRIRKATPGGTLTTIAGTGTQSYCGDNGPAISACFDTPMDVKLDSHGNIYIADTGNSRIRRIDTAGIVTTFLGPDTLRFPCAIALDADDNLYITDWQNFRILKVINAAISDGGIVDGAGFSLPPAPGGIFSIFGANLAAALSQASTTPLPTQLGGVTVTVNNTAVPLYFVSPGQINAQLPYDAVPGPATLRIGATSRTFTIAAAAPAIFAALRQGTVAVAYVTGLGAVKPPVPTGAAAPFDTLSFADTKVTATIDGIAADVAFAGLAPGFIGLGQVNVAIPAGAIDLILVLEANGQKSKPVAIR